jgi:hypothetical protein
MGISSGNGSGKELALDALDYFYFPYSSGPLAD